MLILIREILIIFRLKNKKEETCFRVRAEINVCIIIQSSSVAARTRTRNHLFFKFTGNIVNLNRAGINGKELRTWNTKQRGKMKQVDSLTSVVLRISAFYWPADGHARLRRETEVRQELGPRGALVYPEANVNNCSAWLTCTSYTGSCTPTQQKKLAIDTFVNRVIAGPVIFTVDSHGIAPGKFTYFFEKGTEISCKATAQFFINFHAPAVKLELL